MYFGPIEWLLTVEAIVLLVAGICGSTAYFSRPMNQDPDPFLRAMLGFWRTVGARRPVFDPVGRVPVAGSVDENDDDETEARVTDARKSGKVGSAAGGPASPVLRGGVAPMSVATCTFSVNVVPGSAKNDVLCRDGSGLRIGVSGTADDALANKLVLAIIAREFNVRPYQVTLTRGHFAAAKVVRITGMSRDDAEQSMSRFAAQ